jgi:hypothetical protein
MAEIHTVEIESRECGKRARQGIAVRYLTNAVRRKSRIALRARDRTVAPDSPEEGRQAISENPAAKSRQRLLDPECQFDNQCQQQGHGQDHRNGQLYCEPLGCFLMTHCEAPKFAADTRY